jgi:hypothetical protein
MCNEIKLSGKELDTYLACRYKIEKRQKITTTDLADFGLREREMLTELMVAWSEQGLPDDFEGDNVRAMLNRNSGFVFLTNDDYQVAMINDDNLESFYTCGNCGNEGFAEDCQLNDDGCNVCREIEATEKENECL